MQQLQQIAALRGTPESFLGLEVESVSAVEHLWVDLNKNSHITTSFAP